MEFNSLNPYESLHVVKAISPEALVDELKKIQTPIKILTIVQAGNLSVAYITGDVRVKKTVKLKTIREK